MIFGYNKVSNWNRIISSSRFSSEYNIDKDTEACAVQLDSTFNKLWILAIYKSPRDDFTNFLKWLDLILQKILNNKYSIVIWGDVNVNYLIDNNQRSQVDAVLHSYNLMSLVEFPTKYGLISPTAIDNVSLFLDEWMSERMNEWTDNGVERRAGRWMDGWMYGWMEG